MSEKAACSDSKKRDKKIKKATDKLTAKTTTGEAKSPLKSQKSNQSKKEKLKEENNNNSKQKKSNTKQQQGKSKDEVIKVNIVAGNATADCSGDCNATIDSASIATEEFDVDDTDLQELNICEGNEVEGNLKGGNATPQSECNNNNNHNHNTSATININDNVEQQQQQQSDQKQLKNDDQAIPAEQSHDNDADGGEDQPSSSINSTPVVASTSGELTKQKAAPPAALQLEHKTEPISTQEETYCPITPRRIVDVEEVEECDAPNRVLRSSSSKAIVGNDATRADDLQSTATAASTADPDNDFYDDDEDEPGDELLVQFLGEANRIAEARLAARRQARAEAREIRMRELERQQKEQEQNADRVFDMHASSGIDPLARSRLTVGINSSSPIGGLLNSARANSMSSRRSSEDSLEEEGRSLRDIRHELRDVEERFRKAMIANAQLDNERASQSYQIQLLKDKLEEIEESYAQLQREFKEKSRDCNALKRNLDKLSEELKLVQGQLNERDTLIAEQGLVIVTVENEDGSDAKRALVSCENAHLLGSVQGSLDVRLKKFSEEKQQLLAEVQQLQEQLEHYKSQGKGKGNATNGPTIGDEEYEAQREANKIISDFKYKLQKAEQEIANLQASLARSETQVIRYKSTAEAAEKAEAELKIERRKLQRENREATERLEELETSNNFLLKRLDKLKNAKSALLKDL